MFANSRVAHIILLAMLLLGEQSPYACVEAAEPSFLNSNQTMNSLGATLRNVPPSLRAETATMFQSAPSINSSVPNPSVMRSSAGAFSLPSLPQLPSQANALFAQTGQFGSVLPSTDRAANAANGALGQPGAQQIDRAELINSSRNGASFSSRKNTSAIINSNNPVGTVTGGTSFTTQLPPVIPPVFVAPTLQQMPGVKPVRAVDTSQIARAIPRIVPADGAQFRVSPDGRVSLQSGQILVSTLGRKGAAEIVLPDGTHVVVRRSSTALITSNKGISQVTNTSGSGVLIDPPGNQPVNLELGHEFTSSPGGIAKQTVRLADSVPRRDVVVSTDGQIATAEVSLPALATQNPTLRNVLSTSAGTAEHGIGEAVSKAAAAQRLVRGGERFGINTVESLVQSLIAGLHKPPVPPPPPPVPPPVPTPPPVVSPPGGTIASSTSSAAQQSAAGNGNALNATQLASNTTITTPLSPGSPADQTLPLLRSLALTRPRHGLQATPSVATVPTTTNPQLPVEPTTYPPGQLKSPDNKQLATSSAAQQQPQLSIGTASGPSSTGTGTPWYLAPLAPFLNGVPLSQVPNAIKEEIKRHPNIAAAAIVLIGLLLAMTSYFWWISHRRSVQLAAANAEIKEARDQAIAGSKAKSDFMANISHEIRTPLTVILGLIGMLIELKPSGEQARLLGLLKQSAQHLMDLLTGILDFSKIEANRLVLEFAPFSMSETISEVTQTYRPAAESKGLQLNLEIDKELPQTLIGDPVRLRQILSNLVSNAIKFTEKGAVTVITTSSLQGELCMVTIRVRDTGIGISEEHVDNVFQPFVQADASTTRRFGGTGLGLAISRRLAQMMNGDLAIESKQGIGSEFLLRIPFEIGAAGSHVKPNNHNHVKVSFPGKRILIAEDSPVLRQIVKAQLVKFGCVIDVVENGQQAVEAAKSNRYDLIFMDWQMPVMDGLTATKNIRSIAWDNRKVPIVAMTANAMEGDRTTCLEAGCSDYLSKPFTLEQLRNVLERWLKTE